MKKGQVAWNKGLTKETDVRVLKYALNSENRNRANKNLFKSGKDNINFGGKLSDTDDYRKNMSEVMKEGHKSGRIPLSPSCWKSGKEHPDWKGGISFEPYNQEFNAKLKSYIRNRDGNKCVACSSVGNKRKLCVHHIDFNKQNCDERNLVTVCIPHNIKASRNEKIWQKTFSSYIENLYS